MTPERRACQRFQVAGGTVDWTSKTDPGQGATECPLGDLSRGGVRFLTPGPPKDGTLVEVTLHVPGEAESLQVQGSVAWTLVSGGQLYHVAIAFAPYSAVPGANDPAALERLVGIEARFLDSPA